MHDAWPSTLPASIAAPLVGCAGLSAVASGDSAGGSANELATTAVATPKQISQKNAVRRFLIILKKR
jgi:hypothetical protein